MSCKRNHRARFIGCHVGPGRIRGCSRDCCPYPDTAIEKNERWNYSRGDKPSHYSGHYPRRPDGTPDYTLAPNGYHRCQSPYRPKFVCIPCKRAFKAAIIEGNQYSIWEDRRPGWWFAPEGYLTPTLLDEYLSIQQNPSRRGELDKLMEDEYAHLSGAREFTREELENLRKRSPDSWWQPLNRLRCPECGKNGIAVGSKFRAPAKKDVKAWNRVAEMIGSGDRFTFCLSRTEEVQLMADAQLELARNQTRCQ